MTDRPDGPGEKKSRRLGVREIAKGVGVAPMTVSRALSNPDMVSPETRAKVLQAIEQAGFVPNRLASSMRGNGRMIGTVVPPLINSGIAEQVQGMSDECHESGYSMLLVQGEFTQEAEEKSIRTLLGWRPVGMILQSFVQSETARALLKSSGAPVVEISEIKGRKPIDMVVGVSNFETQHLQRLIDGTSVVPAVDQIELHPHLQQHAAREYHAEHGIATEAWSPLGSGKGLLEVPAIVAIAQKHGRSPAQIVLRWHLQLGNIVIPKSVTPSRIKENIEVFDFTLDIEDLAAISALNEDRRTGPDPATFNAG